MYISMRIGLSTEDIFMHGQSFYHSHAVVSYPTVMNMQRVFSQNASDFHVEGPEKQNVINILSSSFHNNGLFHQLYERCRHCILSSSIKTSVFVICIIYLSNATKCKKDFIGQTY